MYYLIILQNNIIDKYIILNFNAGNLQYLETIIIIILN